ncbi:HAD-like superfamily hydrolases, putative [Babesia bigemina]|uniref:HAD-like superfamily hydrolases, putative n=1 Tax=Babesia bigemina TaxID=5866 RepID=A0A061D437_BABBI|nr:HAD-like superfamily hydrolases, putative [Babesia bigemina]CDR94797.1 HAD-like superfamily hydrolases, putative [Babesia bigemina]|eukprot:XP_012766983.1 HAD-like superfamily hydrolases, putative [Babesia bigemina]
MGFLPRFERSVPYVAFDVDAAFGAPFRSVSRRNAETFMDACGSGQVAFFCTGRGREDSIRMLYDVYDGLPVYNGFPGVYHSGAVVLDKQGRLVHGTYFSKSALKKIVDAVVFTSHQVYTIFCSFDNWLILGSEASSISAVMAKHGVQSELHICTRDQIVNSDISQILVYHYGEVVRVLGALDNILYNLRRDPRGAMQLTPMGVSPAIGMWRLLRYYNISHDMCAYVGHPCDIADMPSLNHERSTIHGSRNEAEHVERVEIISMHSQESGSGDLSVASST